MQKQRTLEGEVIEIDCRKRTGLFYRLNPKTKREAEDAINPRFRVWSRSQKRPATETNIDDFE